MKKQLLLLVMLLLPMVASADDSGTCGEKLTWTFVESTGTLTISGTGAMKKYTTNSSSSYAPWYDYRFKVKTVVIENGVTTIGTYAFADFYNLNSVAISNTVTTIGSNAFDNCPKLASVIIPGSVTTIGYQAFSSLTLKKALWLTKTPPSGYANASGEVNYVVNDQYSSLSNTVVYPYLSSMFTVDGIVYVPVNPSERTCDAIDYVIDASMTNITLPRTVSYNGVAMEVKDIGQNLLYNNTVVKSVTISGNFSTLKTSLFRGCSSLEGITIPASVKTIADYVFSDCSSLKKVIIEDRYDVLKLGKNNKTNHLPLFSDCPLDYVYIGGDISYSTTSGAGYSPFYGNTTLRKVVITGKETEITDKEFSGCSNLQSFSFGSQVKTIGKEAFANCTSLVEMTSKAATPPTCSTQALDDINKWNCKLYVPQGSLAAYQAADQWKEFFFISEGEGGDTPPDPELLKCATPTISFIGGKLHFECETDGVEFHYEFTTPASGNGTGNDVAVSSAYVVNVYASKAGYQDSEVATANVDVRGIKGDVTGDGEVNVADLVTTTNIIMGKDE